MDRAASFLKLDLSKMLVNSHICPILGTSLWLNFEHFKFCPFKLLYYEFRSWLLCMHKSASILPYYPK